MVDQDVVAQKLRELSVVFENGVSKEKFRREVDGGYCYCLLGGLALVCGGPIGPDVLTYSAVEVIEFVNEDKLCREVWSALVVAAGVTKAPDPLVALTYWNDAHATADELKELIAASLKDLT